MLGEAEALTWSAWKEQSSSTATPESSAQHNPVTPLAAPSLTPHRHSSASSSGSPHDKRHVSGSAVTQMSSLHQIRSCNPPAPSSLMLASSSPLRADSSHGASHGARGNWRVTAPSLAQAGHHPQQSLAQRGLHVTSQQEQDLTKPATRVRELEGRMMSSSPHRLASFSRPAPQDSRSQNRSQAAHHRPVPSPQPLLVLAQPEPPAQSGCIHHKMAPTRVAASLSVRVAAPPPQPELETDDSDMLLLSAHQLELAAEANGLLECKVTLTTTAAAEVPVLNVAALLLVLIVPLLLWPQ